MEVVRFYDGTFGVRRRRKLAADQYLSCRNNYWWSEHHHVYEYCRFDKEEDALTAASMAALKCKVILIIDEEK